MPFLRFMRCLMFTFCKPTYLSLYIEENKIDSRFAIVLSLTFIVIFRLDYEPVELNVWDRQKDQTHIRNSCRLIIFDAAVIEDKVQTTTLSILVFWRWRHLAIEIYSSISALSPKRNLKFKRIRQKLHMISILKPILLSGAMKCLVGFPMALKYDLE